MSRGPFAKNVVLDMDETMLHTFDKMPPKDFLHKNQDLGDRIYHIELEDQNLVGVFRPYLNEFIDFCFRYFNHVFIYSAGEDEYVKKIMEIVFTPLCIDHVLQGRCPTAIWTRSDCKVDKEGFYIKPLKLLYKQYPDVNEKNTIIIDDRDNTFAQNVDNAIHIPPYTITAVSEKIRNDKDTNLIKLMNWLSTPEVMNCKDVRTLDKSKIFK